MPIDTKAPAARRSSTHLAALSSVTGQPRAVSLLRLARHAPERRSLGVVSIGTV
ncbi:hypothetical protein AB0F44_11095 [Nocardioides sp. NPDC023903]|uniref:hypothetical protein n=1 Tax=Nocardioides sp. NPDC023903 TaxID=3157195 RepID=UPI0033FC07CC